MPRFYHNRYPELFDSELRAATRAGFVPLEVSSAEFEALAVEGERMIYVVASGRLLVSKRQARGEHISHPVLADGGPVEAAGEFEVMVHGRNRVVTALNNLSGHYQPRTESLRVAVEAFERRGWHVSQGGIHAYDLEAP